MSNLPEIPDASALRKLPADGGEHWNRLVFEHSPYLLQHAANPVQWRPWGDEAFTAAREQDKPIFLSIGYATCHWCHVMARESFEDRQVAALINEHFIPVKVDREERPDIDQAYMTACQAMTGHGGWPLTCFLMPNGEVFYAGTYYPKAGRANRPGMLQLLPGLANAWQTKREDVRNSATQLTRHLRKLSALQPGDGLNADLPARAYAWYRDHFDADHGGFGQAPKFPTPHQYQFLLRYWFRYREPHALAMVEKSLTAMRLGGVFDHVGLGFHRYSTDANWLLPHFEKMLYDQAMLLIAYGETFAATGNQFYRQTALEIVDYVVRDVTHSRGGFFSAEDADSDGEEGLFYVWHMAELHSVLSQPDFDWFASHFNIQAQGNFTDEATREKTGANIPYLSSLPASSADATNQATQLWHDQWQRVRKILFDRRSVRNRPLRDDKILTDWNGLMIAALARASLLLDAPQLLTHASAAWQFVQTHLTSPDDRLLKRFRNDVAGLPAHLDDYAFMIWAALEMYQATMQVDYLEQAVRWQDVAHEEFADLAAGGYFFTAPDTELVVRQKTVYDGAIASGNSFMARNLAVLFQLTGEARWQQRYDQLVRAMSQQVNHFPPGSAMMLIAADLMDMGAQNLVLTGEGMDSTDLAPLRQQFLPDAVWLGLNKLNAARVNRLAPFTEAQIPLAELSLYLCDGFICEHPIRGAERVQARLRSLSTPG